MYSISVIANNLFSKYKNSLWKGACDWDFLNWNYIFNSSTLLNFFKCAFLRFLLKDRTLHVIINEVLETVETSRDNCRD